MSKTLLALAAAALIGGVALHANVVVPAEFREIVTEAALIARGQVTDVRAVDVPGRGIDSVVTVAVESVVKGADTRFVYVRVPGGEIGRSRFVMVGAPTFRVGQRAVWFLREAGDGTWRPVGLSAGVYRLQASARTGQPMVASPIIARLTAPASGRIARGDGRRTLIPVSEFESLVRLVMERRVAVRRGSNR